MIKVNVKISSVLLLLLSISIMLTTQSTAQTSASLKGIKKLGVIIEKFNTDLGKNGISEDGIRQTAWNLLRKNGVNVVPISETKNVPGSPYLYINIGAIKSKHENLYAVSINVALKQNVILTRDTTKEFFGIPTWSVSNIGIISKDKLKQINSFVETEVKEFIMAYKRTND